MSTVTAPRSIVPWRYVAIMLVGSIAGAWAGIFGKLAQEQGVSTSYIILFRQLGGAIFLTPFVLAQFSGEIRNLTRKDIFYTAFAGFWFALHLLAGFEALKHTSILISGVLGSTLPIWIALLESYLMHTSLGKATWIGLGVALIGSTIIALTGGISLSLGDNPALGAVLSLSAAGFGAFYALIGRYTRNRVHFMVYVWLLFASAALTALAFVIVQHVPLFGYSPRVYFYLIMLVILPQLIGHITYNFTLRRVPATFTANLGQVGLVVSVILAYLFFQQMPTIPQIIGSVIMLIGVNYVNTRKTE